MTVAINHLLAFFVSSFHFVFTLICRWDTCVWSLGRTGVVLYFIWYFYLFLLEILPFFPPQNYPFILFVIFSLFHCGIYWRQILFWPPQKESTAEKNLLYEQLWCTFFMSFSFLRRHICLIKGSSCCSLPSRWAALPVLKGYYHHHQLPSLRVCVCVQVTLWEWVSVSSTAWLWSSGRSSLPRASGTTAPSTTAP